MAELGGAVLTLSDWVKSMDPNGKPARIAELLMQTNSILDDAMWKEGNLATGHVITQRTSLPNTTWRMLNQGVAPTKSSTAQITEGIGMLEAFSQVDVELAKLNGNASGFRLNEAKSFLESMNQEMAQTLFYGNTGSAPEEFTGLATRYNSLTGNIGQNVIDGGGVGSDNSSIWLVGWGEQGLFKIFPKGSSIGLQHEDMGQQLVEVAGGIGGSMMRAFIDNWQWKCGLAVQDWRYAVRIANIDISALVAKTSAADLMELMIKATHRIPSLQVVKPVFYVNRTCFQQLDIQGRDDVISGGGLKYENVDGKRISFFRGIPVKLVDQLTEAEAAVS